MDKRNMLRMPRLGDVYETVVLADGDYPSDGYPARFLSNAERVICCDGAVHEFVACGGVPYAIVGDCDSVEDEQRKRFSDIIHCDTDQESNDLTKAVRFCKDRGFMDILILGATGKREDHTLANISLLADYRRELNAVMVSQRGVFDVIFEDASFESCVGQQVSIFTMSPETLITTVDLAYPLGRASLVRWWQGSLNEAKGEVFSILTTGPTIVYRLF